jgi:outer membrane lipoprotein-sorting protein
MLMLRRSLVALAWLALVALPASAQTADEILAKTFAAQGGLDKLKAVQSIRMTGRMTVGPGLEAPVVIEMKRPKAMRLEISIQGTTIVQAYDGTQGWMLNPLTGRTAAEPLPSEMTKLIEEQADMDGPLMDYKSKGHTVELLGKETADGTECYKLKLTQKDGSVTVYYFDAESFLGVKQESKRTVRGSEVENETIVGDWKQVDGVMYPHSIDAGQKGGQMRQKMAIQKIDVNVPIDDARFKMPK